MFTGQKWPTGEPQAELERRDTRQAAATAAAILSGGSQLAYTKNSTGQQVGPASKKQANFNQGLSFNQQQQQQRLSALSNGKLAADPAHESRASLATTTDKVGGGDDNEELDQSSREPHKKRAGRLGRAASAAAARWQLLESGSTGRSNKSADPSSPLLDRLCRFSWRLMRAMSLLLLVNLVVYFWPLGERFTLEPRVAPPKPRPKFEGPLATNMLLDSLGERLYQDQFHAPESMAWTADKRAFFTGVEGGFILLVEPYADRWTVAARLNARHAVEDQSRRAQFELADGKLVSVSGPAAASPAASAASAAPFCSSDVELYGPRAEFEPRLVRLSRCSRPLGIRLAPDDSRLYVMDPLSGLYRIELAPSWWAARASQTRPLHELSRVVKLVDFANQTKPDERPRRPEEIFFADDLAVDFKADLGGGGGSDVIYLTDCSNRWTLRYLFWLMLENDESGRVLEFNVAAARLREVKIERVLTWRPQPDGPELSDSERGLSFPNGIELTANKSALLISDLNNRRILRHHLAGPRAGHTELLMWVPGYSDNIRRGLDQPDGTPTYWYACGCAVNDGEYELAEVVNALPVLRRALIRWLHLIGASLQLLADWLDSTPLKDAGLLVDAVWLKVDPYCTHGLVAQFDERGRVLRTLQAPAFSSHFKLLSEAHQVPLLSFEPAESNRSLAAGEAGARPESVLYLGSVYYDYLGRVVLDEEPAPARAVERDDVRVAAAI